MLGIVEHRIWVAGFLTKIGLLRIAEPREIPATVQHIYNSIL